MVPEVRDEASLVWAARGPRVVAAARAFVAETEKDVRRMYLNARLCIRGSCYGRKFEMGVCIGRR